MNALKHIIDHVISETLVKEVRKTLNNEMVEIVEENAIVKFILIET